MKLDTADELFYSIRNDCLKLISSKNVNLDDLSYSIGCSTEKLISLFNKRDNDLIIYFKIYNTLVEW